MAPAKITTKLNIILVFSVICIFFVITKGFQRDPHSVLLQDKYLAPYIKADESFKKEVETIMKIKKEEEKKKELEKANSNNQENQAQQTDPGQKQMKPLEQPQSSTPQQIHTDPPSHQVQNTNNLPTHPGVTLPVQLRDAEIANAHHSDKFWIIKYDMGSRPTALDFELNYLQYIRLRPPQDNVSFGIVDCQISPRACAEHGVSSFPLLEISFHDKFSTFTYNGTLDRAAVDSWISAFIQSPSSSSIPPSSTTTADPTTSFATPGTPASLNQEQLKQVKESSHFWVVKYFRTTCPACTGFAPLYQTLAAKFKNNPTIHFGEVDCERERPSCQAADIHGVPTIEIYHKGEKIRWSGARKEDTMTEWIVDFVKKQGGNATF